MAASATVLQSLAANPLPRATFSSHLPRQPAGRRIMLVRCQAEEQSTPSNSMETSQTTPSQTPSPPKKKVMSTKFTDVFAFSGPAPERINGRLAMVGFVSAIGVELAKGDGLLDQLSNGGLQWFVYTTVLLSVASLVPLFRGESAQAKTDGLMNSNAELWNGRLAMLGLVALAFTEYVKGGALV